MPGKWGFRRFELTGATPCIGFGSGRQPYVTVMQSADLRERDDLPGTDGLDRSPVGCVFSQRQVRTRPVVVVKIRREDPRAMSESW